MICRDVSLAHGVCRIEVEEGDQPPRYTAHLLILDPSNGRPHPVVFENGQVAQIHATTQDLAINSALMYLEDRFGRV
jgi:hypothetical protein